MTEETRVVSSTGGEKGQKLARYGLIPAGALRRVAELYGKGAQKYSDHNWRRGYDWSLSFDAMLRHAWAFWDGEDFDEDPQIPLGEDGERSPHLAAVVFHALALLTFMEEHPEFDDRRTADEAEKRRKYDLILGSESKKAREPRVWDRIQNVPDRVVAEGEQAPNSRFRQRNGVVQLWMGSWWEDAMNGGDWINDYAPFTEVIEESE
ncbi:dATP/dGTP diphosphohydrolase domain-containing protein [Nocardia sp. NPDC001965]